MYTGNLDAASNRADLIRQVELFDPLTNLPADLTGATITIALRLSGRYGNAPLLTGSTLDGHVNITAPGIFMFHFTRAEMSTFEPGEIDLGITVLFPSGVTEQLFAGQLPIVDGVVAA